jgi:hypothetical protein
VARIRYEVHGQQPEHGLLDELMAGHHRVGIDGLLRRRGRRAYPGRPAVPAAVEGFRWGTLDGWSRRWWPQGIEVLEGYGAGNEDHDGVLLVSWFAQQRRGATQGARITVVDRRDPRRPRYHHVLLVEPVREGSVARMRAVEIHAGGLAVVGDRLYVAATYGGLRTFRLGDILRTRGRGSFGYRHVLPQSGHERLLGGGNSGDGDTRMRFSFVSLERDSAGGTDHLVVGEFGPESVGRRLGRVPVGTASPRVEIIDMHEPGIPRMQGAAVIDGTWFVSASHGSRPGDLWVGSGGTWVRHPAVLPPGPEDLTASHDGRRLWSLSEYPRKRWVFTIDAQRWRAEPAPTSGR